MGRGRAPWRLSGVIGMVALLASAGAGWVLAAERTEGRPVAVPAARGASSTGAALPGVPSEEPQLPLAPAAVATGGVELVSPEPGAKLRGTARLKVDWANPMGYVVFRIDDKFAYASTAPFEMRWDTSTAMDGQHVIAADAYNASARYAGGASISVIVENSIPTPPEGILLAVKFDEHDMLNHAVAAHGELSALREGEVLPTGFDVLQGDLRADLSSSVLDAFYEGASALVRTRLRTAALVTEGQRQSLPEIGRYVMVQVSRNGLAIPAQTASTKPRLGLAEISTAMRDFPVVPGDTWQSPIGVLCDLYTRRTIYVQGRHVFEGLRWFRGHECAVVSSSYHIAEVPLYDRTQQASAVEIRPLARASLELTGMRGGGMRGGGMRGGGMGGGGMRGGGMRGGASMRGGAAGQSRAGAGQRGQPPEVLTARLSDLEGTRMTYLARQSGQILHVEDTILGTLAFRTGAQMARNDVQTPRGSVAIELTGMRGGGMRGGGMRGGGMGGGGMRGGGMRGGAAMRGGGATRAAGRGQTGQGPGAAAGASIPPRLDYGFHLEMDLQTE